MAKHEARELDRKQMKTTTTTKQLCTAMIGFCLESVEELPKILKPGMT